MNPKFWKEKSSQYSAYNDIGAKISEVHNPAYKVSGMHCLVETEDNGRIFVDVLDKDNNRKVGAQVQYNNGTNEPKSITITSPDKMARLSFLNGEPVNVWHAEGEGVVGLEPGYSYLIVFREVDKPKPPSDQTGIKLEINQEWFASLVPDANGNIVFFVGIAQGNER